MIKHTLVFDVNGTLLDTATLEPDFARLIGRPYSSESWNEQVLLMTFTDTLSGVFRPFADIADAALRMVAAKEGRETTAAERSVVVGKLAEQPPFPDVAAGLALLMAKGHRLAVLTNGSRRTAVRQLENAKLNGFFGDNVFSVESVKKYKPAPETYGYVANALEIRPAELTLVAAHAWDTAGAQAAGLKSVFVRRPRRVLNPLGPEPHRIVSDLKDLAKQLNG